MPFPRRMALAGALVFLVLFLLVSRNSPPPAASASANAHAHASIPSPPAVPPQAPRGNDQVRPLPTSAPIRPAIRNLVAALDEGYPARLTVDGSAPRTLFLQPRKLLADAFEITLGAGSDRPSTLAPQLVRTYGGRFLAATGGKLGGTAVVTVVDNAIAAVLTDEQGNVLNAKTDPATGELLTLHENADALLGTCEHDSSTGIASVISEREPHTEEDWRAGPRAQIAAVADDPEVLGAGGVNPGNGRLDKYIEPLPFGRNYDLSLRDLMVLVVLDKDATGGGSDGNLTRVASEYLARMANVAAVHEHQLGIRLLVQELILTPDEAQYDDVPASLGNFRSWIGSNRSRGTFGWNAAAKFGDTATSGGVIGVAYVRALSSGSGVSVNNKGFTHALVAHEMGHNMGSGHSSGGIMNSSIVSGSRTFFNDVSSGETAAKDIYDHTRTRVYGPATMRHAEEIPFARDDDRTTGINTPHVFNPVSNDDNVVRNGTPNTTVTLEEVSRVQPLDAGTVAITGPNEVTFTPSSNWQGMAFFSYSIRGDVGNGGRGWLHKGDAAVQVGAFDANSLDLTLAPGQTFSFRPSGSGNPSIQSQPQFAHVATSRDDRRLVIIRVREGATGSDSFTFSRDGSTSTVNITYLDAAEYLTATPDILFFDGSSSALDFNPLVNDQGGGYLSPASIHPTLNSSGDSRPVTYYFRHSFTATDIGTVTGLNLELLRDDGAVAYLNGTEIARDNMPAGAVASDTLATTSVGGGDETTYFQFNGLSAVPLVEGTNVLAVEVHQNSATSSDLAFDLSLTAAKPAGNVQLVPRNSVWRYLDDGSNQGSAWRAPDFNDGGSFTEVSYGPDPNNKHITTYFLKEFDVANLASITGLVLRVRRDDGIIVHLNTSEIARDNMPVGAAGFQTPASGTASDKGEDFIEFHLPSTGLLPFNNRLAVEIHQASGTSSDIVFDLELEGTTATGPSLIVPRGSVWSYLDDGSDQGILWRLLTFDFNTWKSGAAPLGYGLDGATGWASGPGILGFGDGVEATSLNDGFPSVDLLPGALRVVGATNLDPSKGTLDFSETRPFTVDGSRTNVLSGHMSFAPAPGATGVASIEYTIEDGAGNQTTGTVSIILPLVTITHPEVDSAILDIRNGILLEGIVHGGGQPPLSGSVSPSWSLRSGPQGGVVNFSTPLSESTSARFSVLGEYVLRFTGTDNGFSTFQERTVLVVDSDDAGSLVQGLTAWWKLDETEGVGVADASGNGHTGIRVNSPAPTTGIVGGALDFDAANRFVNFGSHIGSFKDLSQGSIAAWFQTTTGSTRTIFAAADGGDSNRDLRLYIDDERLKYKVRGDMGTSESSISSPQDVNDGEWHHAAVTVDAAMNATLYLDGEVVSTGIRPFFSGLFDIDTLRIGQTVNNNASNELFRGKIDDVRVYQRVLGEGEVVRLASASRNHAPLVTLPDTRPATGSATFDTGLLNPTVDDDGLPASPGSTTTQWSLLSGPGTASFGSASALDTSVTFFSPGLYTLQLAATDGEVTSVDEIRISYTGTGAGVPVSVGIPDVVVPQNAPDTEIDLFAVFEDAQDPDAALSYEVVSNTNGGIFSEASITGGSPRQLVLDYAPGAEGFSDLTIRATDTGGNAIDALFRVTVTNFQPTIPPQIFFVPENSPNGASVGTLASSDADGDPTSFAILGGNTGGVFAINRSSGRITVADSALLDFETSPSYALAIAVTDASHPEFTSTATVSVNVSDVNEAPVINHAFVTAPENAANGTVVTTVSASDPEGRPLTLQIIGGNTSGAFALDPNNGFLEIANAAAFNVTANPQFTLLVRATDDGTPALSDTAEIRVAPEAVLVAEGAPARSLVPTSDADDATWFAPGFPAGTWPSGGTGVGYDTGDDYDDLIGTDVEAEMDGINTTVYVRIPFTVSDPALYSTLTLGMKYDDGYVAYLNGQEVARRNAPGSLAWDSRATGSHSDDDAQVFEFVDISDQSGLLAAGSNVLAIHGLNSSATSSDMLILPQLAASAVGTAAVPAPPELSLGSASGITESEAVLSGQVDATGGDDPDLAFVWGRRAGGDDVSSWENSASLGARGPGAYSRNISGLDPGRTYFFSMVGTNSGGTSLALPALAFTTSLADPITLIAEGAHASGFVPLNASSIDAVWRERGFDDSLWETGALAAGYETNSGYEGLIGNALDFETAMFNRNATLYLRVPFTPANPAAIDRLVLRMKYDDGFVASLNGIEIARRNATPGPQLWNASASGDHPDSEATDFERIDVSEFAGLLVGGGNILAIHGLNGSPDSSDMLISPELLGYALGPASGPQQLYDTWSQTVHGLSGADALVGADPERDGLRNLLEYAFDLDPNAATGLADVTPVSHAGGKLRLTYRRRTDAAARGLAYRVEASADLATWFPAAIEAVESVRPNPGGATDSVTVRLGNAGDPMHARVAVDFAP